MTRNIPACSEPGAQIKRPLSHQDPRVLQHRVKYLLFRNVQRVESSFVHKLEQRSSIVNCLQCVPHLLAVLGLADHFCLLNSRIRHVNVRSGLEIVKLHVPLPKPLARRLLNYASGRAGLNLPRFGLAEVWPDKGVLRNSVRQESDPFFPLYCCNAQFLQVRDRFRLDSGIFTLSRTRNWWSG